MLDGWHHQAKRDTIAWETGNGYLIHNDYDRYDPFTIQDSHGVLPKSAQKDLSPMLIRQASIYPEGRMLSVILKGIDPNQTILKIPTINLLESDAEIPVIIGKRMAKSANLKMGDDVLIRWRDKNGTFDAASVSVVGIFNCDVPAVDNGAGLYCFG